MSGISLTLLLPILSLLPGVGQGTPPQGAAGVTVKVDATHPWVDSGVTVTKGEPVSFSAEGTIRWGTKAEEVAGPEGHGGKAGKIGAGGLIGRVGYNGKPFPIGNPHGPIVMPKSGKLFLGINDFIFGDNAGFFTVTISRPRNPVTGSKGPTPI
jgi:hypothetical protein